MPNRWAGVTIDCLDVEKVAGFWSVLLDRAPGPALPGWVYLGDRGDALPRLVFQPVAEPKRGKVRLHLDVAVDDIAEGIAQVVALGGRFTGERHDYDEGVVVVMADPEDHEFCLTQYF
ncbi:VOC family protein [Streptomyces sp. NPDC049813]|uniref:VOC family protein n=1 Tax=Streptomyces sp. NPDC049813 TaxID=3365597 RepID=UPI0037967155